MILLGLSLGIGILLYCVLMVLAVYKIADLLERK